MKLVDYYSFLFIGSRLVMNINVPKSLNECIAPSPVPHGLLAKTRTCRYHFTNQASAQVDVCVLGTACAVYAGNLNKDTCFRHGA